MLLLPTGNYFLSDRFNVSIVKNVLAVVKFFLVGWTVVATLLVKFFLLR